MIAAKGEWHSAGFREHSSYDEANTQVQWMILNIPKHALTLGVSITSTISSIMVFIVS